MAELDTLTLRLNAFTRMSLTKIYKNICALNGLQVADLPTVSLLAQCCRGDARNFINTLQFLQSRDIKPSDYLSFEFNTSNVFEKDSFCDLFHAAGRLFYVKRSDKNDSNLLCTSLKDRSRNELLLDVNSFLDSLSESKQTLLFTLHENYHKFLASLDQIVLLI